MKLYISLLFVFSMFHLNAQEMERQVIASAGSNMESGNLTLLWTLGELATATHEGNFFDLFINQGFHQEITMLVNTSAPNEGTQIEVFPNPVVETLFIKSDVTSLLNITIVDLMGRIVSSQQLSAPIEKAAIDVSQLPTATYFLRATDEEENLIQIFKIQKINQ